MKKHTIIITIFVLLAAVMQAAADSVWMPMDDYFMDAWKPESDNTCEHLERPFYLAGLCHCREDPPGPDAGKYLPQRD